jgi:hypothetical protein
MTPLEQALVVSVRWVLPGAALALPLLLVPRTEDLLALTIAHLGAVVVLGWMVADRLAPFTDGAWFDGVASPFWRRFGAAAATTALVTGAVALVTLPTAAALRLQPSLQFLQLLSALDIAWVVAATMIGVRWLAGHAAARIAGTVIAAICVWSIWRYLDTVGFAADGGWLVSAPDLARLVLPFDVMAALIAVGTVVVAARRQPREGGAIEQPTPQS